MAKKGMLIVAALVVLTGCIATDRKGTGSSRVPALRAAPIDAGSGNLIALWMPMRGEATGTRLEPVVVKDRYATLIGWPNPEYTEDAATKRVFIFYDNVLKKCWKTRDYEAFLDVVAQQPRGIEVLQIETCSVSRCYMPAEQWKRLETAMAAREMRWASDPVSGGPMRFCYCESTGDFVYPGDGQR